MARQRILKPTFFTNESLGDCSPLARLLFAGLWCWADREGYVEDRPKRLRAEILPYDQADGEELVAELVAAGMIERVEVNGVHVLRIITFSKHQDPHPRETPSRFAQGAPKASLRLAKVPPRSPSPSSPSQPSSPSSNSKPGDAPLSTWEVFRDALADRLAVPRDWLRVSRPEEAEATRAMLSAEVERLGMARAVEVAFEAAARAKSKPKWLRYFVGPLQEATRHRVDQDAWQDGPRSKPWTDEHGRTLAEIQAAEAANGGVL